MKFVVFFQIFDDLIDRVFAKNKIVTVGRKFVSTQFFNELVVCYFMTAVELTGINKVRIVQH